jgi:hypothetical protein
LHINLAGGDQLTGHISMGDLSADIITDHVVYSKTSHPTAKAGSYTLVIPGDVADPHSPGGDGFGTVKVDSAGTISFSGTLADGTKVSQSTTLSKDGLWPLYSSLYSGAGAIASWIQFTNQTFSDLNGQLIWMKPAGAWKYYAHGFTNEILATGSAYKAPPAGRRVLNLAQGAIVFSGGGLSQPITNSFALSPNNKVTGATGSKLTLTITSSSGLFKGTFFDPVSGAKVPFQGVLFKAANIGVGYFLGVDQSGEVYLGPAQ